MTDSRLPILYSRTAKDAVNTWEVWTEGADVCCRWGQMGGVLQTSRYTALAKNLGKKNATTAKEQAVKEAQALHTKQKKKKYNESLEAAGETKRVKPILAQDYEKRKGKIQFPVYVQPKLDGLRCIALRDESGKVVLQSRGGEPYVLPHIQEELDNCYLQATPLDGELYIHGASLQTVNQLVRGQREDMWRVHYHVYDLVKENVPYSERLDELREEMGGLFTYSSSIHLVETQLVHSEEAIRRSHAVLVQQGYEGAIVRTPTGLYREGYRSPDLLKVKSWKDAEFKILSFTAGKGKFENVPTFTCEVAPGKTFDVTPKGTQEERAEMLQNGPELIGKLMKVKFFDYSPDGLPLYPIGLCVRDESDLS